LCGRQQTELQRLKPGCFADAYIVAEATTYKDSRVLTPTLKLTFPFRRIAHKDPTLEPGGSGTRKTIALGAEQRLPHWL
jgi:hypothetical protein